MKRALQGWLVLACVLMLAVTAVAWEQPEGFAPTQDVTQWFPVPYLEFWSQRNGVRDVRCLWLPTAGRVVAQLAVEYRRAANQDPPETVQYRVYVAESGRYLLVVFRTH